MHPWLDNFDFGSVQPKTNLELLVNDSENKIVMFSSKIGLEFLADAEHVLGDGTFRYCPKQFYQIYTFHAYGANEVYVPCAYFLLPNKTQATYTLMLEYLQKKSSRLGVAFVPATFHVDLEVAMINSIRQRHPYAKVSLCHFHLSQSWFKMIQKKGLATQYAKKTSPVGNWLRMVFGMPALPATEVGDFFFNVLKNIEPDASVAEFADYLEKCYIKDDSTYPPDMWSDVGEGVTTTNACESFHRGLEYRFAHTHPNIWEFIMALHAEQHKAELKIRTDKKLYVKKKTRGRFKRTKS